MAWFAAALPYISAASTALGVASHVKAGNEQAAMAEVQANERAEDAKAAQAESQREAMLERRKARNLMSRARAVAGASGAGVSDPTVSNILTDLDTQGEVNALNALFSGNATARGLRSGARAARSEARAYRSAGRYAAASTALDGASSWYEKYGAKKKD